LSPGVRNATPQRDLIAYVSENRVPTRASRGNWKTPGTLFVQAQTTVANGSISRTSLTPARRARASARWSAVRAMSIRRRSSLNQCLQERAGIDHRRSRA